RCATKRERISDAERVRAFLDGAGPEVERQRALPNTGAQRGEGTEHRRAARLEPDAHVVGIADGESGGAESFEVGPLRAGPGGREDRTLDPVVTQTKPELCRHRA